ncbi:MAG: YigZ family protein [Deltaproteobacteria bacterium]|nr:YigZ family protein [Deltaproteobacteria bacterium]
MTSTLASPCQHQVEIKKSRFVARAAPASSPEEALAFLAAVCDPAATHNCWAYRIGACYRFSDDGEPGGTAGRPILGAIEKVGLDRVVVVVTRFFGGIKLGAGGLARAYGGTAAACLRQAEQLPLVHHVRVRLVAGFAAIGRAYELLDRYAAIEREERYTAEGVSICCRIEEPLLAGLCRELGGTGRGALSLEVEQPAVGGASSTPAPASGGPLLSGRSPGDAGGASSRRGR